MRPETLKDAQRIVNLWPNLIRLGSDRIARDIGRQSRGERVTGSGSTAKTLSYRIVELAEARVVRKSGFGEVDIDRLVDRIAPIMPVRPLLEFWLYGDKINFTDNNGRELLRDGKVLDTRLLMHRGPEGLIPGHDSIDVGQMSYPVTRVEGRRGIVEAQEEHRRSVAEARRAGVSGTKDYVSIGELMIARR